MRCKKPVWGTIVFGLIGAMFYLVMAVLVCGYDNFFIWMLTVSYGFCLAFWSGTRHRDLFFPAGLHLMAAFMVPSAQAYILLSLGFLGWLRSGVCFRGRFPGSWGRELLLGPGGLILIVVLMPQTPLAMGLAVWLFFLIQSLYFFIWEPSEGGPEYDRQRFETVMKKFDRNLMRLD